MKLKVGDKVKLYKMFLRCPEDIKHLINCNTHYTIRRYSDVVNLVELKEFPGYFFYEKYFVKCNELKLEKL